MLRFYEMNKIVSKYKYADSFLSNVSSEILKILKPWLEEGQVFH